MEGGQLWDIEVVEVNGEVLFLFVDPANTYYVEAENTKTELFEVTCNTKKVDLELTCPLLPITGGERLLTSESVTNLLVSGLYTFLARALWQRS